MGSWGEEVNRAVMRALPESGWVSTEELLPEVSGLGMTEEKLLPHLFVMQNQGDIVTKDAGGGKFLVSRAAKVEDFEPSRPRPKTLAELEAQGSETSALPSTQRHSSRWEPGL
jgi:hypothetical protein